MVSTFTTNLNLEKQAAGENTDTWGGKVNDVLDQLDDAIAGRLSKSVAGSADVTLTTAEARNAWHEYNGAITGNINVIVPTKEKIYLVFNNTSGSFTLTVRTSAGSGIVITQGKKVPLYADGTDVILAVDPIVDPETTFGKNVLINGDFRVSQRRTDVAFTAATTPANSDDTVLLDHWVLLSDGNDIVDVSQNTTTPTGSWRCIQFEIETTNKKFGLLQIIEERDAAGLIGSAVSLSFKARRSGTSMDHLRAAVLAWDSTADSVTSDVVSAWEAAGTDPTLVTNWTYENIPANLATLTTVFQTFKIENISIETTNATNVAVFIWLDDVTTTLDEDLFITDIQLEKRSIATSFERRPFEQELALCQRYYLKTFPHIVNPVQGVGDEIGAIHAVVQVAGTAGRCSAVWKFPTTMRATPTITYYSPGAASADWWNVIATAQASGAAASLGAGDQGVIIANPQAANDAIQDDVAIHAQAEAEL